MGLFDFLGTKNAVVTENERQKIVEIAVSEIIANQYQPRQVFDEQALEELAASIQEHGILQPIVVRKTTENKYEIIAGERRFRASQKNGAITVPVIVKNMSDEQSAALAIIENIQRENLSVIEEAVAYQQLMILHNLKQEDLA
ncbi:MAG: ParB/RepB/Spo0J family partition protein, partial [Culicoidibacterales bacterium]